MGKIFGTDGARGVANSELTCELAMNIGRAAALVLTDNRHKRPRILIGKDTRISSDMLEGALKAGICSVGADVAILGVVPTPAVAYLVRECKADAGIMISASHNPAEFNGIKIFSGDGYKLPDAMEQQIEELIINGMKDVKYSVGSQVGRVTYENDAVYKYVDHIVKTVSKDLSGVKAIIDCSNGSASRTAESIVKKLSIDAEIICSNPDGININEECGSTHLKKLSEYVRESGADIGIAFDGDADRCLAVDERGEEIDGDFIMAVCAKHMKEEGKLSKDTIVGTIMTNMGFTDFCKESNINFVSTKVGDRYVIEEMLNNGYNFGGEQSGHIIFKDFTTTGDGQLTAVQLLEVVKNLGIKASEIKHLFAKYPQVIINVQVTPEGKAMWKQDIDIQSCILEAQNELQGIGRIIVRESGTEPLIRIMVECKDEKKINDIANRVKEKIVEKIGK